MRARWRRSRWCWGSTAASTATARPCATPTTTPSASATCSQRWAMRTYALARLDDNTRRLHPGEPELPAPRLAALQQAVGRLAARRGGRATAGRRTVLYLVYAGHGKADGPRSGYVTLEDARLRGADLLARIIEPVGADHSHVIVDACQSYFAVLGRGPGGTSAAAARLLRARADRRAARRRAAAVHLHRAREPRVGGVPGGRVQPRGALGPVRRRRRRRRRADHLLRDRLVRGPGQRLGPQRAVPPRRVRQGARGRAGAAGPAAGAAPPHRGRRPGRRATTTWRIRPGVRWADFHNAAAVRLARPSRAPLYLRRASDDREYLLPDGQAVARTSQLALRDAHVAGRGAAHDLFRSLFALPFDAAAVESYRIEVQRRPARAPADVRRAGRSRLATGRDPAAGAPALPRWRWDWWARARPRPSPGRRRCCRPVGCATTSPPGRRRRRCSGSTSASATRNRWGAVLLGAGGRGPAGRRRLVAARAAKRRSISRSAPMGWPPACADRSERSDRARPISANIAGVRPVHALLLLVGGRAACQQRIADRPVRPPAADAGDAIPGPPLRLAEYAPRSMLHVAAHQVPRARFPVIDFHQHTNDHLEVPRPGQRRRQRPDAALPGEAPAGGDGRRQRAHAGRS